MGRKAKNTKGEIETPLRYTVKPGIASKIFMKTLPGAACALRLEGEIDNARRLKLYADQDGIIRFYVRPLSESKDPVKIVVDCKVGDKVRQCPLELRKSFKPTTEMPPPAIEAPKLRKRTHVRPALSDHDLLHLSDKELTKRGYPPRPNPEKAPKAFNSWRRSVSAAMTKIEPEIVSNPDKVHGLAQICDTSSSTSANWSGFELRTDRSDVGPFAGVLASWAVPSVELAPPFPADYACWVGIDGDPKGPNSPTDLVQAGTIQDVLSAGGVTFSSLPSAYWEIIPDFEIPVNLQINPTDTVLVDVWIGDSAGNVDSKGGYAWFYIENQTTSTYVQFPKSLSNYPAVIGSEAQWIVEWPGFNGSTSGLANYGSVTMLDAHAYSSSSNGWVTYQSGTNVQWTLVNGSDILSTVTAIDATSMRFNWRAST